ncbi:hypothetical protein GUJ93_ZPchr0007g5057 [Zizania palustris]|uniref:Bifunctional inhibitor/plant lipid transfer protein/seed storage helical domain-containing protein n=1 Tax=Zizania palustris TaxID=103762 RepID=A0A8J5TDQ3_ZIZPA|nr:hypothetical protein GUJ93_ZPchr0007g5057 [Zizania palustris]
MAKATVPLAALLMMVAAAILAVAPSPADAVCNMSSAQLKTCQPAAATTNPTPNPSAACCAALSGADLPCLCSYKNSPLLSFYDIDPNRAMQLPGKCGLTMPANC